MIPTTKWLVALRDLHKQHLEYAINSERKTGYLAALEDTIVVMENYERDPANNECRSQFLPDVIFRMDDGDRVSVSTEDFQKLRKHLGHTE